MKRKRVGCLQCKTSHFLDDRVKPEHYSGIGWTSVCPNCGNDAFVSMKQLLKHLLEGRNS